MNEREIFLTVVEAKGFSAAAKKLDTTPAAISRKIKKLEDRLGIRLLQRTTRSISLTAEGERYYLEAKSLLDQLNNLEQDLAAQKGQLAGELKIAAPMSFGQKQLAPIISDFASKYPKLRVSLILEDKEADIINEGFDLAIRISYPEDSSLVGRKISDIPVYVCAAPKYLEKKGLPEKPSDLIEHDCLHFNLISERDEWTFHVNHQDESFAINSRFCSNNGDVLAQAAIDGLGIVILPEFIVHDALGSGKLVRILKGYERPALSLYVLYPSRSHLPSKNRKLIEHLADAFSGTT